MNCQETKTLLHGYLDRELDLVRSLEFEEHLKSCPTCSRSLESYRGLQSVLADQAQHFEAPKSLAKRIRSSIGEESQPRESRPPSGWNWSAVWARIVAPLAIAGLATLLAMPLFTGPSAQKQLAQELVSAHVRSLMANHLADVPSSDRHTVKPWFNGKIDFSPPVLDLADKGFPLVGGRLDYFANRQVAALAYQCRKHVINLFIWRSTEPAKSVGRPITLQGYNAFGWNSGGLAFWAVSDVNKDDLKQFVTLFQAETGSN
jgi:anti-sigma factor RsiW